MKTTKDIRTRIDLNRATGENVSNNPLYMFDKTFSY